MTYPVDEAPCDVHYSQAANRAGQGREAWESNGRASGTASGVRSEGNSAGQWDGTKDERFMMSGLTRRYNR
jgi:hypothetical protein